MDPRMIPKGGSNEYNYGEQDGIRRPNQPGVYYHPQADKFVETAGQVRPDGETVYHAQEGKIQADAFVQIGYRPATKEELEAFKAKKKDQEKANRIAASRSSTII